MVVTRNNNVGDDDNLNVRFKFMFRAELLSQEYQCLSMLEKKRRKKEKVEGKTKFD